MSIHRREIRSLCIATVEAYRRGIWNIFRMENEVKNNAGKFRALNLHFINMDDDVGDDEEISSYTETITQGSRSRLGVVSRNIRDNVPSGHHHLKRSPLQRKSKD